MSDAVYAKSIIEEIWDPEVYNRKTIIGEAFDAIKRVERSLSADVLRERKRAWTERRIRSIVDDEEPALLRFEIADLEKMAVSEGKEAYAKSIGRAARIAAFLAHADEDFHGPQIEAHVAVASAALSAGGGLALARPDAPGEGADRSWERPSRIHRSRASGDDR